MVLISIRCQEYKRKIDGKSALQYVDTDTINLSEGDIVHNILLTVIKFFLTVSQLYKMSGWDTKE